MFMGAIRKGTSLQGYIDKGLVDVYLIVSRHNELVMEMGRRGMNHRSPMVDEDIRLILNHTGGGNVDAEANEQELHRRCPNCVKRGMG